MEPSAEATTPTETTRTDAPQTPEPRKRRRLQLGLRALLLFVTLCCVALGAFMGFVRPYLRQAEIRDRIRAIGGITTEAPAPGIGKWFGGIRVLKVDLSGIDDGYSRSCGWLSEYPDPILYRNGHAARDEDYLALLADLGELKNLVMLDVSGNDVTDDIVGHWQDLHELRALNLSGTVVQDATTWPDTWNVLHELNVTGTPMESTGLAAINKYSSLQKLNVSKTACDDATIERWTALSELQSLTLDETRVTFASSQALQKLPNLAEVFLIRTQPRARDTYEPPSDSSILAIPLHAGSLPPAAGMAKYVRSEIHVRRADIRVKESGALPIGFAVTEIAALPDHVLQENGEEVTSLFLDSRYVDDTTLAQLGKFPELRTLVLTDSSITDDGLRHLAQCPQLQDLILRNTRITDAGLHHLKACRNLLLLDLGGTRVTHEGIPILAELCSELRIANLIVPPCALRGPELASLAKIGPVSHGLAAEWGLERIPFFKAIMGPSQNVQARKLAIARPGTWDLESRTGPALSPADAGALLAPSSGYQVVTHVASTPLFGSMSPARPFLKALYLSPEAIQALPPEVREQLEDANR